MKAIQLYVLFAGFMFAGILGWPVIIFLSFFAIGVNIIRKKDLLYHIFSILSLILGAALCYLFIFLRLKYGF